ncbi:EAL domain-containing protein [Gammaproteobacteria bacterium]
MQRIPTLYTLLQESALDSHFQPIVSLKRGTIVGVEALVRDPGNALRSPLPPIHLFAMAKQEGLTLELDRFCRKRAVERYRDLPYLSDPPLLFINFESSVLDQGVGGSGTLIKTVEDAGLQPKDIVIEINESRVQDIEALRRFVSTYRDYGFLIAIDDLGTGYSNLPRIAMLQPHILKLDRSLIQHLEQSYYQQEVFKSMVGLARRVGALVLAEGVETEAEVAISADLGADLMQGYYFGRPGPACALNRIDLEQKLIQAQARQRQNAAIRMDNQRKNNERLDLLLAEATGELRDVTLDAFGHALPKLMEKHTALECAFILDRQGKQISATIETPTAPPQQRSRLFQPAPCGADHSLKEYFYGLMYGGFSRYITEPYISLASGRLCRTLACHFKNANGGTYILCLDTVELFDSTQNTGAEETFLSY